MITIPDADTRQLLQDAAQWRLLGLLFECPNEDWRRNVAALAEEAADPLLQSAARHALEEASEGLYHSIFGPGGPAAPREVSYSDSLQLGRLMYEVTACYRAFGFKPVTVEAPDHVSVEAGFLAYLRMKEAYARARSNPEQAAVAMEAARTFILEHLSLIAEPLAASLEGLGLAYLKEAGRALVARVSARGE